MKTQSRIRKPIPLRLAALALAVAGAMLSGGCTYDDVMQERTAENNYLRGQLAEEEARGARLSN